VSRSVAAVIDLVLTIVAVLLGYVAVSAVLFALRPRSFTWPDLSAVGFGGIWAGVLVIYLTVGWSASGRTLGAQAMGLRVTHAGGGRLTGGVAFARALVASIFPIGLLWCAIDRRNRAVHDLLAGSTVVYDWLPRGSVPAVRAAEDRSSVT
jgi:uncharacterized RDD family membrane protein YckC